MVAAMELKISRRNILAGGAALLSQALPIHAADGTAAKPKLKVSLFSKHLRFLNEEELAKTVADIGFDSIDLTVRKGGHVEPQRVQQDLPALVKIIRQHGLDVTMITTDTVDAETPYLEDILKTMATVGIPNYRLWNLYYTLDKPFGPQLEQMKTRVAKLAALNSRYKVRALYHVDAGVGRVGAAVLDLYTLMKEADPKAIGVNYDLHHAVEAGGSGAWINGFWLLRPYIYGVAIKDFEWAKDAKGTWRPQPKPLGEGGVPLQQFCTILAKSDFSGLVEIHYEYIMGGETDTKGTGIVDRQALYSGMKHDLTKVRELLVQAHL